MYYDIGVHLQETQFTMCHLCYHNGNTPLMIAY